MEAWEQQLFQEAECMVVVFLPVLEGLFVFLATVAVLQEGVGCYQGVYRWNDQYRYRY